MKQRVLVKSFAVVAVLAVVGTILVITIKRVQKHNMESQRKTCLSNMQIIHSAIEGWAMKCELTDGDIIPMTNVVKYMAHSRLPQCPCGGEYTIPPVGKYPSCSFHGAVTDAAWGKKLEWCNRESNGVVFRQSAK